MTKPNKKPIDPNKLVASNSRLQRTDAQMLEALQQVIALSQGGKSKSAPALTAGEVAQRVGVSRQTVEEWVKKGLLPNVALGEPTVIAPAMVQRAAQVERTLAEFDDERPQATFTETPERVSQTRKEQMRRHQGK